MLSVLRNRLCTGNQKLFAAPTILKKNNLSNVVQRKVVFRQTATVAVNMRSEVCPRTQRIVGYWLLGCSGMVSVAVVLGGVTRLTESGLSMVTWRLLGEKLPRTSEEWIEEFQRYQNFPEFKIKNKDITLEEFKSIWWMEYIHRQWGRCIGAAFYIPATIFWARGWFKPVLKKRVVAFGALIGLQGLMGWYMVRSGLENSFDGPNDVPRVSQYRLASHLSLAFILYTLFLWSALDHLIPAQTLSTVQKSATRFRALAHACKGMVFLTAISGAFVAGLDAGLVYNSFPKMADRWIPDDILAFSPKLKNFTENPTTVQFDHRILGISTLSLISGLWLMSKRRKLPPRAYTATNAVAAMAWMQYNLEESSSSNHSHQQSPLPSPTFPAVTRSDSSSSIPSTSSFKSKKARNEQKRSIDAALKEDDEFDGIGINVACKLRRMDEEQRLHAEMLINKILLHGFKGRLQEKTDVTALKFAFPQPPVPHAVLDLQQTLANKSNSPPQETNNNYSLAVQYVMQDENNEELSNYLVIN